MEEEWQTVKNAPTGVWIETKKEGEKGSNVCCLVRDKYGGEEWIEAKTGVTTITHQSFAPPTHWRTYLGVVNWRLQ